MRLILFIFMSGIVAIICLPILIGIFLIRRYKNNNSNSINIADDPIEIQKRRYNEAQGYYRNQRSKQNENQNQSQKQAQCKEYAHTQKREEIPNHNPAQEHDLSKDYAFIEYLKELRNYNQSQTQKQSQRYEKSKKPKEARYCPYNSKEEPEVPIREQEKGVDYKNGYKAKELLTKREKEAYDIIKQVADKKGYAVFTKVRLLDLVEPKEIREDYKKPLWKIQSKHVDFVVSDKNLNPKWVIELQDSSHKRPDRVDRDILVKSILTANNYKVLMSYKVTPEKIDYFLSEEST